jgi:subtilisin-like proprotein convertase family protein
MMQPKNSRRVVFLLTALALLLCGLFMARTTMTDGEAGGDGSVSRNTGADSDADADLAPAPPVRELRDPDAIRYHNQDDGLSLRLSMHEVALFDEHGKDHITPLTPPATPATLAKRIAELEAPMGVYPLAYIEDGEESTSARRIVTRDIRVKMPQNQAEAVARKHGLLVKELPTYAPEWVVFSAERPLDAIAKIEGIRSDAEVEVADVLLAVRQTPKLMPNDPLVANQWHLKTSSGAAPGTDVNIEGVWKYGETGGIRGTGIKIGIVDDGMQHSHPDLIANADTVNDYDWNGNDNDPTPSPFDSHGTACAGVAGGRGNNNLGISGTAPEASLVGMRLIAGAITDSMEAQAMSYLPNLIQISSNSWGPQDDGISLDKPGPLTLAAFANAAANGRNGKGTIFTWAGGNGGNRSDNSNYDSYANSIYTIAVGAIDSSGNRSSYSEPGANVVVVAPSSGAALGITTTDLTGASGETPGDYMNNFTGTSAATPAVSGIIALMLEANPNLGWRDVQAILIRSAKKFKPSDPDWYTNAAGLHFNHNFGAGLIDAMAAVELSKTWTNLAAQASAVSTASNLPLSVPNNVSAGTQVLFPLPGSHLITEHVTVRLSINHSARGDLEISLTSPSGTVSRLAEVRGDTNPNYTDYTLSTVRNWGENSSGTWTLKVADRRSTANTTGGTITAAQLTVFGVFAPPVNTPPDVRITAPAAGSVFSPGVGYTVLVDATDVDINSDPGIVAKVDLYENGDLVATDMVAPYQFTRNPANGFYNYVAKATDSEGLEGESPSVFVVVRNQSPVITAATLNAGSQSFDDLPLTVTDVTATDPESDPLTFSYEWEFSVDEETYTDSGLTGATLAPNPDHSGKLWRCVITARDAVNTSLPYVTGSVNLLDRPSGLPVRPGAPYTYQSGLVLKGDTLVINRQAIIHEFSQGFSGGTSEWVEILTLKAGSLSDWSLEDRSGNAIRFASDAWENIPAGTLIVIYNGGTTKDFVLPADSFDPSTGAMVLSSANLDFFTPTSQWPQLDNIGDSIYLKNSVGLGIHEVSYGNSIFASPNVGRVASGEAAYFAGQSDDGANLASEWLTTTGNIGRSESFSATEPKAIFPGAILTNGQYRQDFDVTPGPTGSSFPTGWSAYSVSIANTQTTNFDELLPPSSASSLGGVFNFGSRIGILGGQNASGVSRLDPGFFALALDNTRNLTGLQISYDIIQISNQPRSMRVTLEYATGNPGNTSTPWFPIAGTTHITGNLPNNTVTRFNNVNLPAIFTNRDSPIYLRWFYRTNTDGSGGTGTRDAIALDNLVISSDSSPNIFMTLSLNPSTISEGAGENASVGTVTLNKALSVPLTVGITSSDTTEATVPTSVIIPAGQLSATFPIAAVDDIFADGTQTSTITLSAAGFLNVSRVITVLDNEPMQVGVTPAKPNNVNNGEFIARIREGRLTEAATFRLADGSVLPLGLSLNTTTGLISGTISPSAAVGTYVVVIERRNVVGGFTSQTIVIFVSENAAISYSEWIGSSGVSDISINGDPDGDFIPNLVEYALGSLPGGFDVPAPIITHGDATSISITYTKSMDVVDVNLVAEWSPTMETGSWRTDGIEHEIMVDGVNSQTIRSSVTVDDAHPFKFLRLRAWLPEPE